MRGRKASAAAAAAAFALLSLVGVVIFRGQGLLYRLESRNEAEQTMNALFTSLKVYDDFGSAIEQNEELKERVLGIGLYGKDGAKIYSWGGAPDRFDVAGLPAPNAGNQARQYEEDAKHRSLVMILRPSRMVPPPPMDELRHRPRGGNGAEAEGGASAEQRAEKPRSMMMELMKDSDVLYLELSQPDFWRKKALLALLFPVFEFALAGLTFFIRFLFVRNAEYKEKLDQQKNLVVLGTAASTIAHEIKNPLLAIRLQTSILEKTMPEESGAEVRIINSEVDRLSRLTTRVNDYLRDPKGFPEEFDPADIAAEVGARLCGRSLVTAGAPGPGRRVLIDPERYRSILENLVRNAIESEGDPDEIAIEISADGGEVFVDVLDRGKGIAKADRARVFDPFFTTKSRGTGIGLAICERFASEAGGKVSLAPREGGGTRARLALPDCEGARAPGDQKRVPDRHSGETS